MKNLNLEVSEPAAQLFFSAPDTNLGEIIKTALELSGRYPFILNRIQADQDSAALEAKFSRLRDKHFYIEKNPSLPMDGIPPLEELKIDNMKLSVGRPRMPAEIVYVFVSIRGYLSSVTNQNAVDIIRDSSTIQRYFAERGLELPAPRTILDNLSHISQKTRDDILNCQMGAVLDDQLDDFAKMTVDSTAVWGNNSWPVDSKLIHDFSKRAFESGKKLRHFGLPPFRAWRIDAWLEKLDRLDFQVSTLGGKPGSRKARKKIYKEIRRIAAKSVARMSSELEIAMENYKPEEFAPSVRERLDRLFQKMNDDLENVLKICEYNCKRMEEEISVPQAEKVLCLADPDASIICKGDREPAFGYKPQLIRSGNGFVPGMIFEAGNISDSASCKPLAELYQGRTGVTPEAFSADDGYASGANRQVLLDMGIGKVSFSGSKGKKIISEDDWNSEDYKALRNERSAVESVIFTLKYIFNFDRALRRGLAAVKEELTEKIIAHNFWRMALLRKRALQAAA